MEQSNDYIEIDLLQILGLLWKKAWVIALAAVIAGAVAFSYAAFLIEPTYEAKAMMYVNNTSVSVGNTSLSINSAELTAAQSLVDTYIVILYSRPTLEKVINANSLDYTTDELKSMISASAENSTEIFRITVSSHDPKEAETIANGIVDVLPDRIADIVDGSSVRTVEWAVVPSVKASPSITKYTIIGMLAGIAVACMILIIQMLSDTLIHDEDYLINTYELPVLAVVPNLNRDSSEGYYGAYEYKADTEEKR